MANLPLGFALTASGAVLLVAGLQNKSVRAVILGESSTPSGSGGSTGGTSGAPGSTMSAGTVAASSRIPNANANLGAGPGAKAAQAALAFMGTPYVWGGLSQVGIDCSGLALEAWHAVGVTLPHNAAQQWLYVKEHGTQKPLSSVVAGDLIFLEPQATGPGHVAVALGNGEAVEAPHTGDKVKVMSIADLVHYDGFVGAGSPLP